MFFLILCVLIAFYTILCNTDAARSDALLCCGGKVMPHVCNMQTGTIVVAHYKLTCRYMFCKKKDYASTKKKSCGRRAWWLSRRASDSRARVRNLPPSCCDLGVSGTLCSRKKGPTQEATVLSRHD